MRHHEVGKFSRVEEGKTVNFLFIDGGFIMLNGPEIINDWNFSSFCVFGQFTDFELEHKGSPNMDLALKNFRNIWT